VSSQADHQPNHVPPWSQADARAVDLIRVLVMDVAEQAGSGHPGTAMSLAPAALARTSRLAAASPVRASSGSEDKEWKP